MLKVTEFVNGQVADSKVVNKECEGNDRCCLSVEFRDCCLFVFGFFKCNLS